MTMNLRAPIQWIVCALLLSTAGFLGAETSYQGLAETSYNPPSETGFASKALQPGTVAKAREMSAMTAGETRYNALGTKSGGRIGLVSSRRDELGYRGFLMGIQAAAIKREGVPLNVAPLAKLSLADQAAELADRGVELFLVDAPDPAEAKEFAENSKVLGRKFALLTHSLPRGYSPPLVVDTPVLHAERAGEEAIRLVGNTEVKVVYILGDHASNSPVENLRESIRANFLKPFRNVASKIDVQELDLAAPTDALVQPAAVVCLTETDSNTIGLTLREKFPQSKIILVGETPAIVDAFEKKRIDIRVRPDYARLLDNALREAGTKSQMPTILQPTIDKWW